MVETGDGGGFNAKSTLAAPAAGRGVVATSQLRRERRATTSMHSVYYSTSDTQYRPPLPPWGVLSCGAARLWILGTSREGYHMAWCFSSSVPPPNHPEGVPAARKYIALRRELTSSLPSDALIVVGINFYSHRLGS